MSALYLCLHCDTYQAGKPPHIKCQKCGCEDDIVKEPEAREEDE